MAEDKTPQPPSESGRVVEGAREERGLFFNTIQGPPVDMVQHATGAPQPGGPTGNTTPPASPAPPPSTPNTSGSGDAE